MDAAMGLAQRKGRMRAFVCGVVVGGNTRLQTLNQLVSEDHSNYLS